MVIFKVCKNLWYLLFFWTFFIPINKESQRGGINWSLVCCKCFPWGVRTHLAAIGMALSALAMLSYSQHLFYSSWVICELCWREDWSFLHSNFFASESLCNQKTGKEIEALLLVKYPEWLQYMPWATKQWT